MGKGKNFIGVSLTLLLTFTFTSYSYDINDMKSQIEKSRAKHFSKRNNGIRGNKLYIYNDFRGKRKKIQIDRDAQINLFQVDMSSKRIKYKRVKIKNIVDNVKIDFRGVIRSQDKVENIYSVNLDELKDVDEVILVNQNGRFDIRGR
jgi:hypothetical protein